MARPARKGLGYFPLDTDFLSDRKIRRLSQKFRSQGVITYIAALCEIYESRGYYVPFSKEFCFDLSFTLQLDEELVEQILIFCVEIRLFDRELLVSKGILSSSGIQSRFRAICKRNACRIDPELELSPAVVSSVVSSASPQNGIASGKEPVKAEITAIPPAENASVDAGKRKASVDAVKRKVAVDAGKKKMAVDGGKEKASVDVGKTAIGSVSTVKRPVKRQKTAAHSVDNSGITVEKPLLSVNNSEIFVDNKGKIVDNSFISVENSSLFPAKTGILPPKTGVSVTKTPVSAAETPLKGKGNIKGKRKENKKESKKESKESKLNIENYGHSEYSSFDDHGEAARRAELLRMVLEATKSR